MIRGRPHPVPRSPGTFSGSIQSCGIRLSCLDGITHTAQGHLATADHAATPDRLTNSNMPQRHRPDKISYGRAALDRAVIPRE